jgi:hypothetical protein
MGQVKDNLTGQDFALRQYGDTGGYAAVYARTQTANIAFFFQYQVYMPTLRRIEYRVATGIDLAEIVVQGWWKPAE